jgi:class 3 adenylate cyclase
MENKRRFRVLIVDDEPMNVELLEAYLSTQYEIAKAYDGEKALEKVNNEPPDLILLDIMMPGLNGYEVCKRLKGDDKINFIPIVMVTALKEQDEKIKGLEAGADDFLTKPVDSSELLARVKSLLRIKYLHDELTQLNRNLEQRVREQVEQIQSLSRLKQYFSPRLAESLIHDMNIGKVRRKDLTIFFIDIRDFTSLSENMEPEELLNLLNEYFAEMIQIIFDYGGTVGKLMGDGIMGFFGDPEECPDHAQRAIKMALEMQQRVSALNEESFWGEFLLSIGIGINTGYVTVGNVGPENHQDYTVIGRHVNLAARLEQEAKPGQILISQRTYKLIKGTIEAEKMGEIAMKGFESLVPIYNVAYQVSA